MTEKFTISVPEEVQSEEMVLIRERRNNYVKGCQNSIRLAVELKRGNVTKEVMGIPGACAAKNRIMINHLLSYPKARYLEVGADTGAMFCSALHGNNPEYACAVESGDTRFLESNTKKFVNTKFDLFKRDPFDLTAAQKKKLKSKRINMYLYDGPHSEEDHVKAISEYYDFLDDVFIIIIPNWLAPQVRTGTFRGLAENKVKVWWQIDLKVDFSGDTKNWWNGVWVAVCQKRKIDK